MRQLAAACENGHGMPVDLQQAADWYRKAVDLGNLTAMNNLAFMYKIGRGVDKDLRIATSLFYPRARLGRRPAMCNLGYAYETGEGVNVRFRPRIYVVQEILGPRLPRRVGCPSATPTTTASG